ncbi:LOW QUALITY PROTEIN: putative chloride channel-like protein CLC-g [Phalaenopsis equestris]|uniref:LOW QUALITY PROTEIN: putative chloride channel-like protein CLC-g n=1 Tax=Phalaenopsis equestris TaxID=78828 RepID=UPI0009E3A513|nr:LOW QUALITY PROTEIN: putative chloride channel-like protein CLC-g [Phalaenopsis equestris]
MATSNTGTSPAPAAEDDENIRDPLLALRPVNLRRYSSNSTSQVAIIGSNLCPIESLDYEVLENDFFKQDWRARGRAHIIRYVILKWTLCLLVGVLAGAIGFFNNMAIENLAGLKFLHTFDLMFANKYLMAFGVFASSNFVLLMFAVAITSCIAPASAGSGIPEVRAYLNGVDAPDIFSPRTIVVKVRNMTLNKTQWRNRIHVPDPMWWNKGFFCWCCFFFFFASIFIFCILTTTFRKGIGHRLLLAGAISIFKSSLPFGLPWFASCQPCPDATPQSCQKLSKTNNFRNFHCPTNYYNDLASLFLITNDDSIRNLYSSGTQKLFNQSSIILWFVYFVTSYILGIISYGVVAPFGLFVPVILTGAIYGRCIGMLMGSRSSLDHGLYAVLGSASFLGGTMRMTVSVCVIILELTNNLLLLPLVMLVLLISKTVADSFNGNIYDLILILKGLPYLDGHAEPYMRQLTVSNVVMGPIQIFNGVEKVGNIVHVLKTTGHHGFPVIDGPPVSTAPVLFGLVLRSHLLILLKNKIFLPTCMRARVDITKEYSSDDFAKNSSGKGDRIEDIVLTQEQMEMYIDLHPFTNTSPYTVVETMSLAKALILFREIGLRHLLVVPKTSCRSPVVGILTRHDFMPEHIFGLHPFLRNSRWKKIRLQGSPLIRSFMCFLLGSTYATSNSISSEF